MLNTMTVGQYSALRKSSRAGRNRSTSRGPASTSGSTTTPTNNPMTYKENDSILVRMIPLRPPSPYMIVMVSTKTFSAREPDQRDSTNPTEMTSNREL